MWRGDGPIIFVDIGVLLMKSEVVLVMSFSLPASPYSLRPPYEIVPIVFSRTNDDRISRQLVHRFEI